MQFSGDFKGIKQQEAALRSSIKASERSENDTSGTTLVVKPSKKTLEINYKGTMFKHES
jgi:hypothetical protein